MNSATQQAFFSTTDRARRRRTDPESSYWAAQGVNVTKVQAMVLNAFIHGPATDHQLWLRIDSRTLSDESTPTPQSVRSRRAELVDKGLVEWTGEWGESEHGGKSRIWRRRQPK